MPRNPARAAAASVPERRENSVVWVAQGVWLDEVFLGIARYAAEHDWTLDAALRYVRGPLKPPVRKPDGILVFTAGTPGLEAIVKAIDVPLVDMEDYCDLYGARKVIGDDLEVGRMAARHLAALNPAELFAVFPSMGSPVAAARRRGFFSEAAKTGFPAREIDRNDFDPKELVRKGPAGIYAATDNLANEVLRRTLAAGVKVPGELAILSGDDFGAICANARVPLSSIDLAMEKKGYVAAALLDRLMRGEKPSMRPVVVPPAGVTERASTRILRSGHDGLDRLVRHFRDNCHRQVGPDTLCTELGIPLRTAQHLLKTKMGVTPGKLLNRFRLETADRIEAVGKMKKDAVARAVGFGGRSGLSRARRANQG